jgi:hypothetical protein
VNRQRLASPTGGRSDAGRDRPVVPRSSFSGCARPPRRSRAGPRQHPWPAWGISSARTRHAEHRLALLPPLGRDLARRTEGREGPPARDAGTGAAGFDARGRVPVSHPRRLRRGDLANLDGAELHRQVRRDKTRHPRHCGHRPGKPPDAAGPTDELSEPRRSRPSRPEAETSLRHGAF